MTPPKQSRTSRPAVLIVTHGDGYLEAFGEPGIDVRFATIPYVGTPRGEVLAEEYLDHTLPDFWRQLYWPGKLRAAGVVRKLLPTTIAEHEELRDLVRSLDPPGPSLQPPRKAEGRQVWVL